MAQKKVSGSFIPILITGICIGWLAGMAASPVLGTILGGVMTICATAITIVMGLEFRSEDDTSKSLETTSIEQSAFPVISNNIRSVNIWPLATLILAISFGAALGVVMRTHNILGSKEERLFEVIHYAKKDGVQATKPESPKPSVFDGVLFAGSGDDIGSIASLHGEALVNALNGLGNTTIQKLVKVYGKDSLSMEMLKNIILKDIKQ